MLYTWTADEIVEFLTRQLEYIDETMFPGKKGLVRTLSDEEINSCDSLEIKNLGSIAFTVLTGDCWKGQVVYLLRKSAMVSMLRRAVNQSLIQASYLPENHLFAIAAHEVRHRSQMELGVTLISPTDVAQHFPQLQDWVKTVESLSESERLDLASNPKEFDALMIEELVRQMDTRKDKYTFTQMTRVIGAKNVEKLKKVFG